MKHDKEAITKLVMIYKNDDLVLDYLKLTLESFTEYIHIINQQEVTTTVDKYRLSKEELLANIKILDMHRRMCHNTIISGIKRINLLCRENSLPLFYEGDELDRVAIADFVMGVVTETFKNRRR